MQTGWSPELTGQSSQSVSFGLSETLPPKMRYTAKDDIRQWMTCGFCRHGYDTVIGIHSNNTHRHTWALHRGWILHRAFVSYVFTDFLQWVVHFWPSHLCWSTILMWNSTFFESELDHKTHRHLKKSLVHMSYLYWLHTATNTNFMILKELRVYNGQHRPSTQTEKKFIWAICQ